VKWVRNLGWAFLALATLAIAIIPEVVTLPKPDGALVLDHATYLPDTGSGSEVALPYAIFPRTSPDLHPARFLIDADLMAKPNENLFLLIAAVNRRISLALNGETFFGFESSPLWTGPLLSAPVMVRLPHDKLVAGRNQITVTVESGLFAIPAYLSQIYVGTEAALAGPFKVRMFLDSQLKTMAVAAHAILGIGLIFAYFFRPKDPLFAWLAIFNVVSLIFSVGMYVGYQPAVVAILPFIIGVATSVGLLYVGVSFALINLRPPKILRVLAIAAPCLFLPMAIIDTMPARIVLVAAAAAVICITVVIGAALTAWGAFWGNNTDARLMLGPTILIAWFAVRDVYVTATLPEHGLALLATYPRPFYLAFITAVLMRRMGASLDQVDSANETLNIRLAEREAELAALHRQERAKTVNTVREHERQRLTHDLHDGLSGHLASIIALSERAGDKPIEQAAREALNDLRLVIYSLDLGDRELPLALANFRERLVPQLQRLGIALDWSIAGLPDVSGVTPGNALAVLRILQEAITNAIKHGPARKVVIRGARAKDGMVALSIENDGRPFTEGAGGHGLTNMRRRAQQLNGKLDLEALDRGTKITLLLPPSLPDFEDEAVA
jgi:two-component system, NarL family, sensor histidine kinase UhpB